MNARDGSGPGSDEARYVSYFHELDAWTEYWDIYHPETRGRYYFGDGGSEAGLLTCFLPRERMPPAFLTWKRLALYEDEALRFEEEVRKPTVAKAVLEVDDLVAQVFARHFGDAARPDVQADYLEAIHRFAIDVLPPAHDRDRRIPDDDPRKATAGRHTLDGDLMWFAWALHLEAVQVLRGIDRGQPRRALQMAGVATACPANFAWRAHRRTRVEYTPTPQTTTLLRTRGLALARDFGAAANEVHALFRIREWGES